MSEIKVAAENAPRCRQCNFKSGNALPGRDPSDPDSTRFPICPSCLGTGIQLDIPEDIRTAILEAKTERRKLESQLADIVSEYGEAPTAEQFFEKIRAEMMGNLEGFVKVMDDIRVEITPENSKEIHAKVAAGNYALEVMGYEPLYAIYEGRVTPTGEESLCDCRGQYQLIQWYLALGRDLSADPTRLPIVQKALDDLLEGCLQPKQLLVDSFPMDYLQKTSTTYSDDCYALEHGEADLAVTYGDALYELLKLPKGISAISAAPELYAKYHVQMEQLRDGRISRWDLDEGSMRILLKAAIAAQASIHSNPTRIPQPSSRFNLSSCHCQNVLASIKTAIAELQASSFTDASAFTKTAREMYEYQLEKRRLIQHELSLPYICEELVILSMASQALTECLMTKRGAIDRRCLAYQISRKGGLLKALWMMQTYWYSQKMDHSIVTQGLMNFVMHHIVIVPSVRSLDDKERMKSMFSGIMKRFSTSLQRKEVLPEAPPKVSDLIKCLHTGHQMVALKFARTTRHQSLRHAIKDSMNFFERLVAWFRRVPI